MDIKFVRTKIVETGFILKNRTIFLNEELQFLLFFFAKTLVIKSNVFCKEK